MTASSSGAAPRSTASAPASATSASSIGRFELRVSDLSGTHRSARDALVPGREPPDACAPHGFHLLHAQAREHTEVRGAEHGAGREHEVTSGEITARESDVVTGPHRVEHAHDFA